MSRTKITTAPWVYIVLLIGAAISLSGVWTLIGDGVTWELCSLAALSVLFIVGLIEAKTIVIENQAKVIKIASIFKAKEIRKEQIVKVSFTEGGNTEMLLDDGASVKIPITGRNEMGVANTVRSWIK